LEQRLLFQSGTGVLLIRRLGDALAAGHAREAQILLEDGGAQALTEDPVPAAVLIAITDRAEPGVILTQRPTTMRKHAGQVAFPGGRVDESDASLIAAALREAEEEVALSAGDVSIIGVTDCYKTITGYVITPVIGVIPPDVQLTANDDEVTQIFEVPLAYLLDPENQKQQNVDWNGQARRYYEITWENHRIWGATAAMIVNLSRRLAW
jgi:8-oxo-dGTP pyrophosphatase MutT (NUDIX family)